MDKNHYIERRLKHEDRVISEGELLSLSRFLVVLAEPGAGKTELLNHFAMLLNTTRHRASIFRYSEGNPIGDKLVIDGFDEVAKLDNSAIDSIIAKVSACQPSQTIFASRSGEWDETRYANLIADSLGEKPLTVRLLPFDTDEQEILFRVHYPDEKFSDFLNRSTDFELHNLLGNPQFLKLFADAYVQNERKFESKKQIFNDAIKRLSEEKNPNTPTGNRLDVESLIHIAEEVFANILLAGSAGVASSEAFSDRNFPFLPTVKSGEKSNVNQIIDTGLFKPADSNSLNEPVHRIVAEYCAGRYLARRIENKTDQLTIRRILAIIAPNGIVREELRGLLGWLTTSLAQENQATCIELDPYAVLSNGDPSQLSNKSKIFLLDCLGKLSKNDPYFRRADRWRNFSVKGFFTADVVEAVKGHLTQNDDNNDLVNLILELLSGSQVVQLLTTEIENIMFESKNKLMTRQRAAHNLIGLNDWEHSKAIKKLIEAGALNDLHIGTQFILKRGLKGTSKKNVLNLLQAVAANYGKGNIRKDRVIGSTYFVLELISTFELSEIECFLDSLSSGLKCSCGAKERYECHCRNGISKIIGKLLDRYFHLSKGPYNARQVWVWIKGLNFHNQSTAMLSRSVNELQSNTKLRQSIQLLAFEGLCDEDEIWKMRCRFDMGEMHSGVGFQQSDYENLVDHAFSTDNNDLWTGFCLNHNWHSKDHAPSPLRTKLRYQAKQKPELLKIWSLRNRKCRELRSEYRLKRYRFQSRQRVKKRKIKTRNLEHFQANRELIESGQHRGWLMTFSEHYLMGSSDILDYIDDPSVPEKALANSIHIISKEIPSLQEIGVPASNSNWSRLVTLAHAASLAYYRINGALDSVDLAILQAAKANEDVSYSSNERKDKETFKNELNRCLFKSDADVIQFARDYIEPQLKNDSNSHTSVSWLKYKPELEPARKLLPLEWLLTYNNMPLTAVDTLFDLCKVNGEIEELNHLIMTRCVAIHKSWPYGPPTKQMKNARDFWFLRSFAFIKINFLSEWICLMPYHDTIFMLAGIYNRWENVSETKWPSPSAAKIFLILETFVDVWPKVHLPNSSGSDSPKEERAYRFLGELIWQIGNDEPKKQVVALDKIISDQRFSNFHNDARHIRANANREIRLQDFNAPLPQQISRMLGENCIATVEDLRAYLMDELKDYQIWVKESETDPLDSFYQKGKRVDENTARNRIVDRLQARLNPLDITIPIERQMANTARCDFTAEISINGIQRVLVVEVKGQWHRELYSAAKEQLYNRYAHHPNASEQGIYLVLWFGADEKIAGKKDSSINSASELKNEILNKMPAEMRNIVDVVVLDLTRNKI